MTREHGKKNLDKEDQHHKRGPDSGPRLISYGAGKQFFPKSAEYFNPKNFEGLSFAELGVWEYLTFLAWKRGDWIIPASVDFLERKLSHRGVASGAVKRHLKTLRQHGFLALRGCGYRSRSGVYKKANLFLVSPLLMWEGGKEPEREKLRNFSAALFLAVTSSDPFDPMTGSNRSDGRKKPSLHRIKMIDSITLRSFLLGGAPRYCRTNQSAGGVTGNAGKRSPTDRSHGGAEKGIGLTADEIERKVAKMKGQLEKLSTMEKTKPASKVDKCNSDADARI